MPYTSLKKNEYANSISINNHFSRFIFTVKRQAKRVAGRWPESDGKKGTGSTCLPSFAKATEDRSAERSQWPVFPALARV